MRMCLGLRLEQRLEVQRPWVSLPATKGLEGLRMANQALKDYRTHGILIGGLAKEIWSGTTDPDVFASHKDVDVIVLSRNCGHHPGQWEAGIDWWINHRYNELPTNGTSVNLLWRLSKRPEGMVPFGLYLPSDDLFRESLVQEKKILGADYQVPEVKFVNRPAFTEFPVMPRKFLGVSWGHGASVPAEHCKLAE
jgi:hypothetical protein